jgi:hypothetical protein
MLEAVQMDVLVGAIFLGLYEWQMHGIYEIMR